MNFCRDFALVSLCALASSLLAQTPRTKLVPLAIAPPEDVVRSKPIGELSLAGPLHLSISLPYADVDAVERFVDAVSDPASPLYRQFITPAEVGRRFGITNTQVQSVASYLASKGMQVTLVGQNRLTILADATVAQAEAAFHTTITEFQPSAAHPGAANRLYSFTTAPTVPVKISDAILSVNGMESFTRPKPLNTYVTPTQLRTLYNLAPMYDSGLHGEGRTIGISNWDGYRLSGLPFEYNEFFLPKPAKGVGSNVKIEKVSGGAGSGDQQGEGDLDIQSILGVAPLCNLVIYDGGNSDLIGVLTKEANDDSVDIITESYGWTLDPPTSLAAHNLHLSMSAQGITYMAATGDSGTTINQYPYPDLDPEVLMVGGTTAIVDNKGNRISEKGWQYGGGGWNVMTYPFNKLPSYQKGTGVPKNIPFRLLPDLALNADPNTGYVVYIDGQFYVIGGTSGASPTFAGSFGVSEQQLIAYGSLKVDKKGKYRYGRIQTMIYGFNGDPTVFLDVKSGANGVLPNGTQSRAGTGWDTVTGWGVMNFEGFVKKQSHRK